ncbi:hypothetical protein E2C01_097231 [Portunus trituberculatus]|uniref:Uncharacterized protein n=1 Tax=Portunus trituberculatus TaxID=210409 RepID=A0A5B7JUM6_PORTR|nr:hypothetical protein [Portunus trituberculatus]
MAPALAHRKHPVAAEGSLATLKERLVGNSIPGHSPLSLSPPTTHWPWEALTQSRTTPPPPPFATRQRGP